MTSSGVSRKLIGTAIAPMALAARTATTNSGRLVIRIATRSPRCTPRSANTVAKVSIWSRSSAQVIDVPSNRRATVSGIEWACRAT